jgi:hypothetical protein
MNSMHVIEQGFQTDSFFRERQPGKNIPAAAARLLMGILERLHRCQAPRIISVQCLTNEGGVRNEA